MAVQDNASPAGLSPPRAGKGPETRWIMEMQELLQTAMEYRASDLHITSDIPPMLRVNGQLATVGGESLTAGDTKRLVYSILTGRQKEMFEKDLELDFSLDVAGIGRFRANVHMQRGAVEAALRAVPLEVQGLDQLGMPAIVADLAMCRDGLVLITGPTGVGKTTTMAAMVDLINTRRQCLVICIEDPIEYVHRHKKSIVKQREVHSDTLSFASALRHVLRQDPDVVCVGEMRDLETIATALTAAETGHLVMSTLHTPDACQTIDRIIDVFPPHQQQQVRVQLAGALQGVISQQLLPRADGGGRVAAVEIMAITSAIRNLIRTGKTEQIQTVIQTGSEHGMVSMDRSLKELCRSGTISYEAAVSRARNPDEFQRM